MSTEITPERFVEVLKADIDQWERLADKDLDDITMPYEYWMVGFVITLFKDAGLLGFLQQTIKKTLENKWNT